MIGTMTIEVDGWTVVGMVVGMVIGQFLVNFVRVIWRAHR